MKLYPHGGSFPAASAARLALNGQARLPRTRLRRGLLTAALVLGVCVGALAAPAKESSHIVSFKSVVDGVLVSDRIVSYTDKGKYLVSENGVLVGRGSFEGSLDRLDDWAHRYAHGLSSHTSPVPEPATVVMLLGGLALLGAVHRRRSH